MGGGTGGSRSQNSAVDEQIKNNVARTIRYFPTSSGGYFGSRSTSSKTRNIADKNPERGAKKMFDSLTKGQRVQVDKSSGRRRATFRDGSNITFRPKSRDGSPVIDINLRSQRSGIAKKQKVHFIQEKP